MADDQFNQEITPMIDYKFWARMSGWTVAEAAALLLDLDPDHLPEPSEDFGTPGCNYRRLLRLLDRAAVMKELESPMAPRDLLKWAASNGLKPPEELGVTVRAGKPYRNWRKRYDKMRIERDALREERDDLAEQINDRPHPRERSTLLKILAGVTRAKFRHKTGSPNTTKLIQDALDAEGCGVSNNAIRAHLVAADEVFESLNLK